MASKDTHLSIIRHNYSCLEYLSIRETEFIDWCVTIIFYMALHYLHAFFDKKKLHPNGYNDLFRYIEEDVRIRRIVQKIKNLRDDSWSARYTGEKLSIYELRNSVLVWFNDIQDVIKNLLNIPENQTYNLHDLFSLN